MPGAKALCGPAPTSLFPEPRTGRSGRVAKARGRRKKTARTGLRDRARTAARWLRRGALGLVIAAVAWVAIYAVVPVPVTPYMISERLRLGSPLDRDWIPIEAMNPDLLRAVVAAEDANFCLHWGFDMSAIRAAIAEGARRGGSTISQQTVKNAFLWHGRSWLRKALEAAMTPVMELIWSKRRVLEVYLNIAEFDEGVFGAEAASLHYFGVSADALTPAQAARLAAVLPDPQGRSASQPSDFLASRARSIESGAATIRTDGRDDCFAD
ncbi:monofunctional biosynthetic peptidoglycan transglycosylase [Rhodobacterales bacterium HKCCE2091]|nr:monofunctional biosynthetic peptidoglycan transglycosylase [Rhodobacterales bacterium HKCCE2091]